MTRMAVASVLLLSSIFYIAVGDEATRNTIQVKLNGHTFTLPAGFEIELVAGPPLVNRPVTADFDEQGRLYVSDSSGSNENVNIQLKKKPHRILRLEDTNGDGKFDKATVFADQMMFPEGTMWYAGSLYVSAPPSIWKLTDTNGDGVADERSEWFQGKTLTGCANDLHGPYLGPDGWIYWCKGAFAPQTYDRPGRKPMATKAAHIFRARPDGSGVEAVMTGGMDNPVDLVFTPGGERIFTTTFLVFPGGGMRDGLIHDVYGGVYGKTWDVLNNHPWTGPSVMPVLSHLGPAAPCGLTRYESAVFGNDYQDNLFACLFNMQKVTRHLLTQDGATFKSRDEDFLVSDNKDFHPTDVLEDADGSLLVVDTGGWYKLCCPTSQLYKPDVLGGIYRVRKKDVRQVTDPRGLKIDWPRTEPAELIKKLDDPRPVVRRRTMAALAELGKQDVAATLKAIERILADTGQTVVRRVNAAWVATRIDHPSARALVRSVVNDANETVVQAAGHSVAVWRDREAVPELLKLLESPHLPNRRIAAEALGRIGDKRAVRNLLEAAAEPADRFVEHSIIYALIEIGAAKETAAGLDSEHVRTRRAALIALDQMEGGNLQAEMAARELASPEPRMKAAAWWIAGRHPEWSAALTGILGERLAAKNLSVPEGHELAGQLARLAANANIQDFLAQRLAKSEASEHERRIVLDAMRQSGLKKVPDSWTSALTDVLSREDAKLTKDAVAAARSLAITPQQGEKLTAELLHIGGNPKIPVEVRLQALAAVPGGLGGVSGEQFAFLRSHLDREQAVAARSLAADVLARAQLTPAQLNDLAGSLQSTGPMELNRLLDAFTRTTDDKVGHTLLTALSAPALRTSLRAETLKPRLAKYGPAVQKEAGKLYAALDASFAEQKARLEKMLGILKEGDIRRGQAVFNSPKAACVSCHAIGYIGGKIGPDLTRIGQIRTERDLLEAIVFPSASFVRGYEPVVVTTRDGKLVNGLVKKDAADEVILTTAADKEERIARDNIEEMQPSQVSVMPAGLDQQLSMRDLADLVAFLKACR
jgi:putative membrane-bound dehydrogenase-like protein